MVHLTSFTAIISTAVKVHQVRTSGDKCNLKLETGNIQIPLLSKLGKPGTQVPSFLPFPLYGFFFLTLCYFYVAPSFFMIIFTYFFLCVYTGICAIDSSGCGPRFPSCLGTRSLCGLMLSIQANWPASFQGFPRPSSCIPAGVLVKDSHCCIWLYRGSGEWNLGPHRAHSIMPPAHDCSLTHPFPVCPLPPVCSL